MHRLLMTDVIADVPLPQAQAVPRTKRRVPTAWNIPIESMAVGDFVMLEVLYDNVQGKQRKGISAAKVLPLYTSLL